MTEFIYGNKSFKTEKTFFLSDSDFSIPPGIQETFSIEFLNSIQDSKINNKTIVELFSFDNFSLWWFIHPTIFPVIKKLVNFIIYFQKFIHEFKPKKIIIENNFQMFDIIKQICEQSNIELNYSKSNFQKFKIKNTLIFKGQKIRYKKITNKKIEKRKKLFLKKNKSIPDLDEKIIFAIPTVYRRQISNRLTGSSENGEYIQQEIMDLIDNNEKIIGIDLDYTFRGDEKILEERLNTPIPWAPLELLINDNVHSKNKLFLKEIQFLIKDKNFQKLFSFNGISLWKQIEPIFTNLTFAPHIPFYLNLISSLENIFKKMKPKVIFLPYETGPLALAFIITARKYGIKTIGIAHTIIWSGNPMYSYNKISIDEKGIGFPIPDNTLLFGNFSKQILLNENYPASNFTVFGNPMFFNIKKIFQNLKNNATAKKYGIKDDQIIILFTTSYLQKYYKQRGGFDYDTRTFSQLLQKFSNHEKYTIILKPHPSENSTIYEKLIKENNAKNFKIIQGNLFELIFISSIVISIISNTIIDALTLKKPVIQISFNQLEFPIPLSKYGVVLKSELDDLHHSVEELLNNPDLCQKLIKNSDLFVKEQYGIPENNPKDVIKQILSD